MCFGNARGGLTARCFLFFYIRYSSTFSKQNARIIRETQQQESKEMAKVLRKKGRGRGSKGVAVYHHAVRVAPQTCTSHTVMMPKRGTTTWMLR